MSDKELEEYINKIEPNFNSHLEKGTIEMSNEYYNLLEEKMVRLINKNQELNKKYVNAVADYETTMFEKEQLKKQLEEKNKPQIFIDTQNIEERYAEGLYQDYLEEENKQLKIQISAREEVCNRLEDNWNKLKEDLIKIRKLTFTKYNKNEWENCLSFNDDILPLIEKMKELEKGSDGNE